MPPSAIQRGGINTGSMGVSGGTHHPGDAATGLGVRQFIKWADAFEPQKTPFLTSLDKLSPVNGIGKIEWGVKARLPHRVALGEALDNVEDEITLASGHGARVQQGQILFIPVDASLNAEEMVWVAEEPVADSLDNVIRGYAGTSAVAHDNGTVCELLAPAMPELSDHPLAPVVFGNLFYNYPQRIPQMIRVDKRADVAPDLEHPNANIFETRLEEKVVMAKRWLEKSFILGMRTPEDYANKRPSTFSGLRHFSILSGNSYNMDKQLLNHYAFEEVLGDMWEEVDDEAGTHAAMNMKTKRLLDMEFNDKRLATMKDTTADYRVEKIKFTVGTITAHIFRDIPDGEIYIYNPEYLGYAPVEGLDWHVRRKKAGEDTGGDYEEGSVSADMTFFAFAPSTMAIIHNFQTNRAAYPMGI